jgi:hypothetical protein
MIREKDITTELLDIDLLHAEAQALMDSRPDLEQGSLDEWLATHAGAGNLSITEQTKAYDLIEAIMESDYY